MAYIIMLYGTEMLYNVKYSSKCLLGSFLMFISVQFLWSKYFICRHLKIRRSSNVNYFMTGIIKYNEDSVKYQSGVKTWSAEYDYTLTSS